MRVLFDSTTGKIYYPVPDRDWFMFHHSTNIPLTEFEIEEILPNNQGACIDMVKVQGKTDAAGDAKYYMFNNAGTWELHIKDGWEEYVPPMG